MDWLLHLIKHMIQHAVVHKVDKGIGNVVKAVEPTTKATIKVVGQVVNEFYAAKEAALTDEQRRQRAEREAEEYARQVRLEEDRRLVWKARAKVFWTC